MDDDSRDFEVEEIADAAFIVEVKKSLYKGNYAPLVKELREGMLKDYPVFLLGGAVRNPMIKVVHGEHREPSDYDLLVDDRRRPIDFNRFFNDEFELFYNRFGNLKIQNANGISVDIVPFTKKNLFHDGNRGVELTLNSILQSCDFVMSAVAFDLDKEIIYNYGAYYDILDRKINILRETDPASVMMSRAVLYERKLEFGLGSNVKKLILQHYSPALNHDIRKYLEYKGKSKDYNYVIGRLKNIAEQKV